METDFVNMYIERILKEVEELTKVRLLNEAKIAYIEKANAELLLKVQQLETPKKGKKEVNTSETF